jgi:hypothetical protein
MDFPGGQSPNTQVIVDIVEFDDCIVDDYGLVAEWYTVTTLNSADEALVITPNLNRARLRQTITACNLVDDTDCRTLNLDVQWRGQGEPQSGVGFTLRDAIAWGRVFDATHRLNLAPEPTDLAQLSRFDAP